MSDTQADNEDEQLTESPKSRWELLSTLTVLGTVLAFLGLTVGASIETVPVVAPGSYLLGAFLAATFGAYSYAIGKDVAAIFTDLKSGPAE